MSHLLLHCGFSVVTSLSNGFSNLVINEFAKTYGGEKHPSPHLRMQRTALVKNDAKSKVSKFDIELATWMLLNEHYVKVSAGFYQTGIVPFCGLISRCQIGLQGSP